MKEAGVNGRRCRIRAAKTVDVQTGARYEITTDDQTVTLPWPSRSASCPMQTGASYELITADGDMRTISWPRERLERCLPWGDCFYYPDTVGVHFYVRGEGESGKISALSQRGYVRIVAIARKWNIPSARVGQRDDFPVPAKSVGTRNLWSLEDLAAWWTRDGRHAPN